MGREETRQPAMKYVNVVYRFFADALIAHGWMWIGSPWPLLLRTSLNAPPPGHPERLRPDIPLTATEALLDRELTH
ncbi:DUF6059 family protein [Streptomyces sp. NPDC018610]|uniref:DUF6059 family protein n=1 Tax=Streptomyces sp. NPDC018610 TaxID=3365049 RepID=UPI0037BC0830